MDVDSAADELYGLAPEEFVARRTELERAARSDGDRTLAGKIKGLAKPTRSAWLVNQLSRDRPEAVEELLDLAELLAEGMRAMSAPELQQLTRQRSTLVAAITRTALAVGRDRGHRAGESIRAEVASTLTAALADPEIAEQVRTGRMVRAASWSGFGLPGSPAPAQHQRAGDVGGMGNAPTSDMAPVVELAPHRREAERTRARKRLARATEELRRATAAATRSTSRVTEAEEQTSRAHQESAPAREALQQAETALAEAERAVRRASRERDRLADVAERAAAVLATAQGRLQQLRDDDARARTRVADAEGELSSAEDAVAALGEDT